MIYFVCLFFLCATEYQNYLAKIFLDRKYRWKQGEEKGNWKLYFQFTECVHTWMIDFIHWYCGVVNEEKSVARQTKKFCRV